MNPTNLTNMSIVSSELEITLLNSRKIKDDYFHKELSVKINKSISIDGSWRDYKENVSYHVIINCKVAKL